MSQSLTSINFNYINAAVILFYLLNIIFNIILLSKPKHRFIFTLIVAKESIGLPSLNTYSKKVTDLAPVPLTIFQSIQIISKFTKSKYSIEFELTMYKCQKWMTLALIVTCPVAVEDCSQLWLVGSIENIFTNVFMIVYIRRLHFFFKLLNQIYQTSLSPSSRPIHPTTIVAERSPSWPWVVDPHSCLSIALTGHIVNHVPNQRASFRFTSIGPTFQKTGLTECLALKNIGDSEKIAENNNFLWYFSEI